MLNFCKFKFVQITSVCLICLICFLPAGSGVKAEQVSRSRVEKNVLRYIRSEAFRNLDQDHVCRAKDGYTVFLIDNFSQRVDIVPEVKTTHGEMVRRVLQSGRPDIEINVLNTSLSRGLAEIINKLSRGACADAVVSSTPGSNYTYGQISNFFLGQDKIFAGNILAYRERLAERIREIAFSGFPSVEWATRADMNLSKLRDDAAAFVFIEAIGRLGIPVILPYGNRDTEYKGEIRAVNILSLARSAKVYSGIDQEGQDIEGFPYSPLSSGKEQAVYDIRECPWPPDPFKAGLDINSDGYFEYSYRRKKPLSADETCISRGIVSGTSLIPPNKVKELLPPKK